jgi:TPP-dependent pyruvate/acetoin dehydrogenase alpha subunit
MTRWVACDFTTAVANPGVAPTIDLRAGYRLMLTSRLLGERAFRLQRQGRLGTFASATGQEAAIAGSVMALDPRVDWVVPQYRELAALLYQGVSLTQIFLYFMGRPASRPYPQDVNVVPIQIALAAQIPHATGLAWGLKHQEKDGVVLVYFGEGSASEGDFHEGINLAGLRKAPVIFFLQNNGWAISTPQRLQSAATSLASRAEGYGIAGATVDGNDIGAVYAATATAVARARAGEGPTLIEAVTYRQGPHNTADNADIYMDPEDLGKWEGRDPLQHARGLLLEQDALTAAEEEALREEIEAEIAAAVEEAEAFPEGGVEALFDDVSETVSPRVQRQRAELEEADR